MSPTSCKRRKNSGALCKFQDDATHVVRKPLQEHDDGGHVEGNSCMCLSLALAMTSIDNKICNVLYSTLKCNASAFVLSRL